MSHLYNIKSRVALRLSGASGPLRHPRCLAPRRPKCGFSSRRIRWFHSGQSSEDEVWGWRTVEWQTEGYKAGGRRTREWRPGDGVVAPAVLTQDSHRKTWDGYCLWRKRPQVRMMFFLPLGGRYMYSHMQLYRACPFRSRKNTRKNVFLRNTVLKPNEGMWLCCTCLPANSYRLKIFVFQYSMILW